MAQRKIRRSARRIEEAYTARVNAVKGRALRRKSQNTRRDPGYIFSPQMKNSGPGLLIFNLYLGSSLIFAIFNGGNNSVNKLPYQFRQVLIIVVRRDLGSKGTWRGDCGLTTRTHAIMRHAVPIQGNAIKDDQDRERLLEQLRLGLEIYA